MKTLYVLPLSLIVALAISTASVDAQNFTAAEAAAFDRGDREAGDLLSVLRCARQAALARRDGAFGPIDSLGRSHQCIRANERWVVIFADLDTTFRAARNVRAFDLHSRAPISAAVDTAAFIALERAELTAQRRGANDYRTSKRQYSPIAMRFPGDTIEVWLVPISLVFGPPTIGGERGYVFTPDGKKILREIDSFADFRPVEVADSGVVRIASSQALLPTMSEFILANILHDLGRQVSIVTARMTSTLTTTANGDVWIQLVRE